VNSTYCCEPSAFRKGTSSNFAANALGPGPRVGPTENAEVPYLKQLLTRFPLAGIDFLASCRPIPASCDLGGVPGAPLHRAPWSGYLTISIIMTTDMLLDAHE